MKIILHIIMWIAVLGVQAQTSMDSVFARIEQNNKQLKYYQNLLDTRETGLKTGILPSGPGFETEHLTGGINGVAVQEYRIVQPFELPFIYMSKYKEASLFRKNKELYYEKYRRELLLEAKVILTKLVYYNKMLQVVEQRSEQNKTWYHLFEKQTDAGETSLPELNRAKVQYLRVMNHKKSLEIEREKLLNQLKKLNGGIAINFNDTIYAEALVPFSMDSIIGIYEKSDPVLKTLRVEKDLAAQKITTAKLANLPSFQAGLKYEYEGSARLSGYVIGVSLPLWSNANKVKEMKLKEAGQRLKIEQYENELFHDLKNEYETYISFFEMYRESKEMLDYDNVDHILKKSFRAGQISAISYFQELNFYYSLLDQLYEYEMKAQLAMTRLLQYNL